jgi:hypothetical protein
MPTDPRLAYQKRKIARLTREIAEIDRFFYGVSANDPAPSLHAGMMERKRDDVVRAAVLQLHTATEDALDILIVSRVLNATARTRKSKLRTVSGKALGQLVHGGGSMGFNMKVSLAVALRLIRESTAERLREVNTLRNKVSHNWLLAMTVRRGRRPAEKKPPLLAYRGHDLHKVDVFKGFVHDATAVYLQLFMRMPD